MSGRWLNSVMVGVLRGEVGRDVGVREGEGRKALAVLRVWRMGPWLAEAPCFTYPLAAFLIVPQTPKLLLFSGAVFLGGLLFFRRMANRGVRRLSWLEQEGHDPPG